MRTIGQNIRYYRKLRGYSQEKLAEMADINEKLIGFYETGKRIPPVINLVAIMVQPFPRAAGEFR